MLVTGRIGLAVAVVAMMLVVAPATAGADEPDQMGEEHVEEETGDEHQRAQQHFDKGAQLYYEGEYSRAAVEFRRAHEVHPHPLFLYNFALANMQLGRIDDAREGAIEARQMDEPLPPEQDARNEAIIAGADTLSAGHLVTEQIAEHSEEIPPPPQPQAEDTGFGWRGWGGIFALGAGTAALTGGLGIELSLRPDREELEQRKETNPNADGVARLESSIESRELTSRILIGSGAGLMVMGTGLLIWNATDGHADEPSAIRLNVSPHFVGISGQW